MQLQRLTERSSTACLATHPQLRHIVLAPAQKDVQLQTVEAKAVLMQIIDLFSGIGGFSLAGRWAGWNTIQFVEIDKYCQMVLKKHWPNVPIHSDIKTFGPETL